MTSFITGVLTRVTRQVPLVEEELLPFRSIWVHPSFSEVRVAQSSFLCSMLSTIIYLFALWIIVSSVLRITASDYRFGILKLIAGAVQNVARLWGKRSFRPLHIVNIYEDESFIFQHITQILRGESPMFSKRCIRNCFVYNVLDVIICLTVCFIGFASNEQYFSYIDDLCFIDWFIGQCHVGSISIILTTCVLLIDLLVNAMRAVFQLYWRLVFYWLICWSMSCGQYFSYIEDLCFIDWFIGQCHVGSISVILMTQLLRQKLF